jgi:quercetin dioxygenase-like cupin family protein
MKQPKFMGRLVVAAVVVSAVALASSSSAQVGLERKILLQHDLTIAGYETILAEVTVAVGAREGRHWHAGTLVAYILEGELTLELEEHPTKLLRAGDSVLIEPHQVHEGINTGSVPVRALVTFIVEKGRPLSSPAP